MEKWDFMYPRARSHHRRPIVLIGAVIGWDTTRSQILPNGTSAYADQKTLERDILGGTGDVNANMVDVG